MDTNWNKCRGKLWVQQLQNLFREKELKAWGHLSGLQKIDRYIDTITDSKVKNRGREVDL